MNARQRILITGLSALAVLSACNNVQTKRLSAPQPTSSDTAASAAVTYTITNITIAPPNTGANYLTSVYFSAADPDISIMNSCSLAAGTRPCKCQFKWQDLNNSTGTSVPIDRVVSTDLKSVQPSLVTCDAPSVYTTEILSGTAISISIIPTGTNGSSFAAGPKVYTKSSTAQSGTFQDVEGRAFDDILRYSCFDQTEKGLEVKSGYITRTDDVDSGEPKPVFYSNKFAANGSNAGTQALSLPEKGPTAQAYYYNFYIRNTARGTINAENATMRCPLVQEALSSAGQGSQGQYYPLDSTFALALNPSGLFNVGVAARTRLRISNGNGQGDPTEEGGGSCDVAAAGGNAANTTGPVLTGCLGYAALPATDGTCPTITVNGIVKPTYRLRRYVALYPPHYQATGKMVDSAQPSDLIYVLDRPVTYTGPGADPTKPYTTLGPKPCPFSFFDRKGVVYPNVNPGSYPDKLPGYVSTNNPVWNGVNPDGIELPNIDDASKQSCSATLPLYNRFSTKWSVATVNATNPVWKHAYIRPMRAWAPHYEEDTTFKACAPQPSIMKDPPLHFSKNPTTGNVAWCAEAYPSQNPHIDDAVIEPNPAAGSVINYTSHVVKNSTSTSCNSTQLEYFRYSNVNYVATPAGGNCGSVGAMSPPIASARHPSTLVMDSYLPLTGVACTGGVTADGFNNRCYYCANKTCDRTVVSNSLKTRIPLLARPDWVESALANDATYECRVTYDNNGIKTGVKTPTQGCCGGSVRVWTGNGTASQYLYNKSAHLEPDPDPATNTLCATPSY